VDETKAKIAEQVKLPADFWLDYGGTFEKFGNPSHRLSIVVPATLYLILALLVVVLANSMMP
jgi:cobalt-zinc-cadmium resistance protein CzcA